MWRVFRLAIEPSFSPQFTTHPPRNHHQKTTSNTPYLPQPPSKTPVKPGKNGSTGASDFFCETDSFNTADSNKPARSTGRGRGKHTVVAEEADSAAAFAAAAAERLRPADSTPPETPS
jgi:hypothetical protein